MSLVAIVDCSCAWMGPVKVVYRKGWTHGKMLDALSGRPQFMIGTAVCAKTCCACFLVALKLIGSADHEDCRLKKKFEPMHKEAITTAAESFHVVCANRRK